MIRISLVEGESQRIVEITGRDVIRVGRDPSSDVLVRDRFVSARHGEIRFGPDGPRYEDFATTNGSRVRRGERIIPVDSSTFHVVPLFAGDEILIGDQAHPAILRIDLGATLTPTLAAFGLPASAEVDATHAETMGRLSLGFDRDALLALHHLTTRLSRNLEVGDLLADFSTCVLEAFQRANQVSLYLLDDNTGEFRPAASRSRDGDTGTQPVSRTVRDRVLAKGKAVIFDETEEGFDCAESLHDASVRAGLCAPLWDGRRVIGLVQVDTRGSLSRSTFGQKDLEALVVFAHQAAMALANARLHENLRRTAEHAIRGLVNALEAKDTYTAGHSEDVADLCVGTCKAMGLDPDFTDTIRRAALLHDIGKISIPYHVLNKRDALSAEEFRILKTHVDVGARILEPFDFLGGLVPIVRHHHERWDGRGYPDGLAGEDIPLGARILSACDTWHSLISHRPYRIGLDHDTALQELQRCSGTQFEPAVVEVLVAVVEASRRETHGAPSLVG
jgi:putative nucleotidyltransferase with HDIG domain